MGLADSLFTYQTGKVVAIKSKVYVLLSLIARSELHSELQMGLTFLSILCARASIIYYIILLCVLAFVIGTSSV